MANIELYWTSTEPISIRKYASDCGFNLLTLDILKVPDDQRKWIEKKVVTSILADVDAAWAKAEWAAPLSQVEKGVYVITMAGNLCIEYKVRPSQVLYIGRGKLRNRLYGHMKNWITYFTESLQDIRFRFWMTEIKVPGSANAFKEVESDLICRFQEKFGEFPLLNHKNGDVCHKYHTYGPSLTVPFQNDRSIKAGWSIKPMQENEWFKEIKED